MNSDSYFPPPAGVYATYVPYNRRRVGEICPQTHPEQFKVSDLRKEMNMLTRLDKKNGAHPLRDQARFKLVQHILERREKYGNTP